MKYEQLDKEFMKPYNPSKEQLKSQLKEMAYAYGEWAKESKQ